MLRSEKEKLIAELTDRFNRAKSVVVAEFTRLDVTTDTALRKKFRDGGAEYKVIKNTLAKRAAKGTAFEQVSDDFVGPVALALGYEDVVAPAKILSEFLEGSKDTEIIKIKSGVVEGKKIDVKGVEALAKLPGLPQLRAQILSMINQPASKLVRTIAEPGSSLARLIKARGEALAGQK